MYDSSITGELNPQTHTWLPRTKRTKRKKVSSRRRIDCNLFLALVSKYKYEFSSTSRTNLKIAVHWKKQLDFYKSLSYAVVDPTLYDINDFENWM